jgi:HemY protein
MIRLIVLVAAMVAGLIFGPQASGNKGYVLISLGNYTVESSVTSAVILAVLFYGALLIVEWVLGRCACAARRWAGSAPAAAARPTCKPWLPPWPWPRGTTARPRS